MMKKMMKVNRVIMAAITKAQTIRLAMKPIIAGYLHGSARSAQAKMLPPGYGYGLALLPDSDPAARLAAANHGVVPRLGRGGQQLVVLAEGEVLIPRPRRERNFVELDDEPTPGAGGDALCVAGE